MNSLVTLHTKEANRIDDPDKARLHGPPDTLENYLSPNAEAQVYCTNEEREEFERKTTKPRRESRRRRLVKLKIMNISTAHKLALSSDYRQKTKMEFTLAFAGGRRVLTMLYRFETETAGKESVYAICNVDHPHPLEITADTYKRIVTGTNGGESSIAAEVVGL